MNKNKKNKNVNKILIISVVAIAIVVFGLAIVKSDILSNSRLFNLLRASIAERTYTVDDKRNAIVETAEAFRRRGTNIQYDTLRRTYLTTPEESTVDDVHYVDGASFVYSVYKQTFNIDVAPTAESLYTYATTNKGSNYVVRVLTQSELGSYTDQSALYTALSADLKVGDIVVAARTIGTNTNYHAMLVTGVSGTTVTLTQALGKNIYTNASGTYSLDEEVIATKSANSDFNASYYENNSSVAITKSYTLQNMLTNYYPLNTIKAYAVIRPLGANGTTYLTYGNNSKQINLTATAKARLKYSGIEITKTSNKHDNTTVNPNDTITYTVSIKNNSSTTYSGIDIVENVVGVGTIASSDGTVNVSEKTITWSNLSIASGATKNLQYTVKVTGNKDYLGTDVVTSGSLDGISTGEIKLTISNTLTDTEKTALSTSIGASATLQTVSDTYKNMTRFSIADNITGFDVDSFFNYGESEDEEEDEDSNSIYTYMLVNDIFCSDSNIDIGRRKYIKLSEVDLDLSDEESVDFNLTTFDDAQKHSITEGNLIYGDIILVSDKKYIYTSNGLLNFDGTNNISTSNIREFLDNLHAKNRFVILRPSIATPAIVDVYSTNKRTATTVGGTISLDVDIYEDNIYYDEINTITWSSSNTDIATVDANGVVTGKAVGTVTITATASNGRTGNIGISVKESLNNNTSLTSVKAYEYNFEKIGDSATPLKTFTSLSTDSASTADIAEGIERVLLKIQPSESTTTYRISRIQNVTGTIDFDEGDNYDDDYIDIYPGNNVISIETTAESGAIATYQIKFNKAYTDSSKLNSLEVYNSELYSSSGALIEFNPNVTSYRATIITDTLESDDETSVSVVDIVAIPVLKGVNITINSPTNLVYGENTFTIVVKGIDASTPSTTYTLVVTLKQPTANDTSLTSITVDGDRISLSEGTNEYVKEVDSCENIEVQYEKKNGQTVEVLEEPGDDTCSSSILTYKYRVTAADGATQREYTIYVLKVSSSAKLNSLVVKNGDTILPLSPTFNSNTHEYTVEVEHSVKSITITGTTDSTSSSTLAGPEELNVGNNVYNYIVTTYNGASEISALYKITIKRKASNQNTLSELSVSGYNIQPVFNENVKNYTLTVDSSVESVYVVAAYDTNGDYRVIEGAGTRELTGTQTVLNIDVTPTGGDTNTYTITVTKLSSTSFEDLTVENGYLIIDDEMTVGTVKSKVGTSNNPKIKSGSTEITNTNTKVATGNTLTVNDQTYTIVVLGDFNKDGYVDDGDVYDIYIYTFNAIFNPGSNTSTEVQLKAGDFNKDGALDDGDVYDLYIYTYRKIFGGE